MAKIANSLNLPASSNSPALTIGNSFNYLGTNTLDCVGSAAFGSYAGFIAPANSLIVSGSLGVGTASPTTKLQVIGSGFIGSGGGTSRSGGLTIDISTSATFAAGTDILDANRTLSLLNENNTTNSYVSLSFRPFVNTTTTILDLVYQATGSGAGTLNFQYDVNGTITTQHVLKSNGQMGIGTSTPDASSLLQISSTIQGFLPPVMTTSQRDTGGTPVNTPATGLVIYNSSYDNLQLYSGATTGWISCGLRVNIQVFASSGTYTPTTGMTYCIVEMVGGGGGGAGSQNSSGTQATAGGGGGSGEYACGVFTAVQIGASQSVTCGTRGSAGPTPGTTTGGNGGTTSLGVLLTAAGGIGGANASAGGTAGGSHGGAGGTGGSGGISHVPGSPGTHGFAVWVGSIGFGAAGNGGSSFFGGGATTPVVPVNSSNANFAGVAGVNGGGGSGGSAEGTISGAVGGAGGLGFVRIIEFY